MYNFYYDHLEAKYGNRCTLSTIHRHRLPLLPHLNSKFVQGHGGGLEQIRNQQFRKKPSSLFHQKSPGTGQVQVWNGFSRTQGVRGVDGENVLLRLREKPQKKAKGVKKDVVKKNVHHQDFLAVLKREKITPWQNFTRKSTNHVLNTVQMTKLCLNAFDDKRFILEDGSNTLPYGHYRAV